MILRKDHLCKRDSPGKKNEYIYIYIYVFVGINYIPDVIKKFDDEKVTI